MPSNVVLAHAKEKTPEVMHPFWEVAAMASNPSKATTKIAGKVDNVVVDAAKTSTKLSNQFDSADSLIQGASDWDKVKARNAGLC